MTTAYPVIDIASDAFKLNTNRYPVLMLRILLVALLLLPSCTSPPPATRDLTAEAPFHHREGWLGGDGACTVVLGNSALWLFGDSGIGHVNDKGAYAEGSTLVNNTLGVQLLHNSLHGQSPIRYFWREARDAADGKTKPAALFTPRNDSEWYWPTGGGTSFEANGQITLILFMSRIFRPRPKDDGIWNFDGRGSDLLIIQNPTPDPREWQPTTIETPGALKPGETPTPNTPRITWGTSVMQLPTHQDAPETAPRADFRSTLLELRSSGRSLATGEAPSPREAQPVEPEHDSLRRSQEPNRRVTRIDDVRENAESTTPTTVAFPTRQPPLNPQSGGQYGATGEATSLRGAQPVEPGCAIPRRSQDPNRRTTRIDDGPESADSTTPPAKRADSTLTPRAAGMPPDLFIFGIDTTDPFNKKAILARVPAPEVADTTRWLFWSTDHWSPNLSDATPIAENLMDEYSVHEVRGTFVMVYSEPMLGKRIFSRTAKNLTGPWSEPQTLYTCPEPDVDNRLFAYSAKAHPEFSKPGELMITYCVNSNDFWHTLSDASIYRPRAVRVPTP